MMEILSLVRTLTLFLRHKRLRFFPVPGSCMCLTVILFPGERLLEPSQAFCMEPDPTWVFYCFRVLNIPDCSKSLQPHIRRQDIADVNHDREVRFLDNSLKLQGCCKTQTILFDTAGQDGSAKGDDIPDPLSFGKYERDHSYLWQFHAWLSPVHQNSDIVIRILRCIAAARRFMFCCKSGEFRLPLKKLTVGVIHMFDGSLQGKFIGQMQKFEFLL